MKLDKLLNYLNKEFRIENFDDASFNGLQTVGKEEIKKIATAVDASVEILKKARKYDVLIVHHGLFWRNKPIEKIDSVLKEKLKLLFENNISLYALHLPLDAHPILGNNAQIARVLNLKKLERISAGFVTKPKRNLSFDELCELCEDKIGIVESYAFGKRRVEKVAINSGRGGKLVYENGFDTLITGEIVYEDILYAKEKGINLIVGGHYETEVFGVRALAEKLNHKFKVKAQFLPEE